MTVLALMTALCGMALGQRCKVVVILPVMAGVLPVAVCIGLAQGLSVWMTAMTYIAASASLQMGYLAGVCIRYALAAARLRGAHRASAMRSTPVHTGASR
jgi:hypothetical protein